jgi:ABC-2 type transport system permease protein
MRVSVVFKAVTKSWLRSRSGLFFSFLFPVIFILLFGSSSSQADYYLPGLIAACVMTNGMVGMTNVATEFRKTGLSKRFSATLLTKLDWILGSVLSQTVLAVALAAVMTILGIGIYHTAVTIDLYTALTLFAGVVLFSGVGMTLAGLVRDPEIASGLGNAMAFPMMFVSGTFWSVSVMPGFFRALASVLPLTYFSEGLRDSMVAGSANAAPLHLGATVAFAVAFIAIGAKVTRWREG